MILMAFILSSAITIGNFSNVKVNDVRIVRSVNSYIETCMIKIPATARLKQSGVPDTNLDQKILSTTDVFKVGDAVSVDLGYDGENNAEFRGFIKRVNFTQPVELECEGYSWLLRNKSYKATLQNTTLKALLEYITAGMDITISSDTGDVSIDKFVLMDKSHGAISGAQVLDYLKEKYKLTVFFKNFNQLYAGLQQTIQNTPANAVKYQMGWNVIRDNELKFHDATDTKMKVIVISGKVDGTHVSATVGDEGGYITTEDLPAGLDHDFCLGVANDLLRQSKYSGYQGKITTFIQPYAQPGDEADITDLRYSERSGNYFIDSIEVQYGRNGARRIVGIGDSLSA